MIPVTHPLEKTHTKKKRIKTTSGDATIAANATFVKYPKPREEYREAFVHSHENF